MISDRLRRMRVYRLLRLAQAAALLLLIFWTGRCAPSRRQAERDRAWKEAEAWLREWQERFPKTAANPAALALEQSAAGLGIDLVPARQRHRSQPLPEAGGVFDRIRPALKQYVEGELARPDDTIREPPNGVRDYLEAQADVVSELSRRILSARDSPAWEREVALGPDAPVPNLLGQLHLQRVLLAQALRRAVSGNEEESEQLLEAAWKVNEGLRTRPELISQITAIAIARWQLAVLRKLGAPGPAWIARIFEPDARQGLIQAFEGEAFSFAIGIQEVSLPKTWWSPGPRREIASYTRNIRALAAELKKQNACTYDPGRARRLWEKQVPRRSLGELFFPNLQETPHRMFRLLLESELTANVLQAKAVRSCSSDSSRSPGRQSVGSKVCPGAQWNYRVAGETVTISFGGDFPAWPRSGALDLPLFHTLGTRRAGSGPKLRETGDVALSFPRARTL